MQITSGMHEFIYDFSEFPNALIEMFPLVFMDIY